MIIILSFLKSHPKFEIVMFWIINLVISVWLFNLVISKSICKIVKIDLQLLDLAVIVSYKWQTE